MKTKTKHPTTPPPPKKPCNIPVAAQEIAPFQKKVVLHVACCIFPTHTSLKNKPNQLIQNNLRNISKISPHSPPCNNE